MNLKQRVVALALFLAVPSALMSSVLSMYPMPPAMLSAPPVLPPTAVGPMPMGMPAPILLPSLPIQGPISFPVKVAMPIESEPANITPQNVALAVPFPVQSSVQIAVPAYPPPSFCQARPRPNNCPVCPPCLCAPSCTPAFFSYCSPCHQKCRCRNRDDTPEPMMPLPPVPIQEPVFGVPVPLSPVMIQKPSLMMPVIPPRPRPPVLGSISSESSDKSSSSEFNIHNFRKRKLYIKQKHTYRRTAKNKNKNRDYDDSDKDKPQLIYIKNDNDVEFKSKLSDDEVKRLFGEKYVDT